MLTVTEAEAAPKVAWRVNKVFLQVRPGADAARRRAVMAAWYREEVRRAAAPLVARWQEVMGMTAGPLYVQAMRTRWGTCHTRTGAIRLNSELAKRAPPCLEYVVVHELTHLLERGHNAVLCVDGRVFAAVAAVAR